MPGDDEESTSAQRLKQGHLRESDGLTAVHQCRAIMTPNLCNSSSAPGTSLKPSIPNDEIAHISRSQPLSSSPKLVNAEDLLDPSQPSDPVTAEIDEIDHQWAILEPLYDAGGPGPFELPGRFSELAFEQWSNRQPRKLKLLFVVDDTPASQLGTISVFGDPSHEHEAVAAILHDVVTEGLKTAIASILQRDTKTNFKGSESKL
jgi:hypothetical protein